MAAELIAFKASNEAKSTIIEILEKALESARSGEMTDVAVVAAIRDKDGPQHWHMYYGQSAYATLVAGVAALTFSIQYDKHKESEE